MSPVEAIAFPVVFAAGYSLGVFSGVKIRHRRLTREVAVQIRVLKRWLDQWGMVFVGLVLLAAAGLTYQSQRDSGNAVHAVKMQNDCLTTYANRLYDSLTPRQAASESLQAADEAFNDALVTLLKDTLSAHPVQATSHSDAVALAAAAQNKQAVADHLSAERAANPYPSPPKKVCPK